MQGSLLLLLCRFTLLLVSCKISSAADTITRTQPLTKNQTLVSSGRIFELGFFTQENSSNWYLGIWYKNVENRTVVWTANRDNPLQDSSRLLAINDNGSLVIRTKTDFVIWSSSNQSNMENPVVQLLDSGNLVMKHEGNDDPESYIWQSFDHPTDTFLPGMKLGWDFRKGLNRYLTSWKDSEDPSTGEYTYGMDPLGYPQLFLTKGSVKQFRTGPWNGLRFSGIPEIQSDGLLFNPTFVYDDKEVYYSYDRENYVILSRTKLYPSGILEASWKDQRQGWRTLDLQKDRCDSYGLCGAYGTCTITKVPVCQCLKGFIPKSPQAWRSGNWSAGCTRRVELDCSDGDGFVKYTSLKLPYSSECFVNKKMTTEECKKECLKNCSCRAYTNSNISGEGSGCVMWFGDLMDTRQFDKDGQDLYMRMAASELGVTADSRKRKKNVTVIVLVSIAVVMLFLGSIICYFIWKAKLRAEGKSERGDLELPLFDFLTISSATNNFSSENMLGEGGFGPVYKGELSTGQEIAVKRLSQKSGQGLAEFKNEVILIVKLQHCNLVRLLGCCIQKEEKMLIYEYMPNNSLDSFLFDQERRMILTWERRFHIVVGIAQGLLYLHTFSRLKIIHRDLKASNILLDSQMNPKISDFGMARIFGGDQKEVETGRIVGTYGYMPPEYLIDGRFSVKSDVFSFGVLVLEIVSGKKNRGFYHPDHGLNLLGHAWNLWNKSKAMELVDVSVQDCQPASEALRLIQVGLLCVQQRPEDRPNMSSVVLMLCSEITVLDQPTQPGFYDARHPVEGDLSSSAKKPYSSNEITVTLLQGR